MANPPSVEQVREALMRCADADPHAATLAASLEGCQIVPVEPTEAMVWKGAAILADSEHGPIECYISDAGQCYRAMLAVRG